MFNVHDFYRPFLKHFRTARAQRFYRTLGVGSETTVLDVGGNGYFWRLVRELHLPFPASVTILNIYAQNEDLPLGVTWHVGDARCMPFPDKHFDVAFSNSVIEHLGSYANQIAMARNIQRVAKSYWVQTPEPRFPIEPHYITPFVHWIPPAARQRVLRNFTVWGLVTRPSSQKAQELVEEIRLIWPGEFREMFFDGKIIVERFCGWPKSMIAVRKDPAIELPAPD
jgi:ubiquinone/menaquinone biosynthesis C-methylase UbiE